MKSRTTAMIDLAHLLSEDAAARARALDPQRSFVVQAPAGSGKTELLTQRVLRLLALVDQPEQVLAITFTRKAAGEMRERILKALLEAIDPAAAAPQAPHERLTRELAREARRNAEAQGWALAEHPARLQVQTIDAFNLALVRQLPLLARFGVMPAITDEPGALYAAAARTTLARLGDDDPLAPACAALLRHLDGDVGQSVELLASMLAKRDQWLPVVVGPLKAGRAELDRMLEQEVVHQLRKVHGALLELPAGPRDELVVLAAGAGQRMAESDSTHPLASLAGCVVLPLDHAAQLPQWRALVELLLTKDGGYRKALNKNIGFPPAARAEKQRMEALIALLREQHTDLAASLDGLRALPDAHYSDAQWAVLAALLAVLPEAAAELKVVFGERGQVDYAEVAEGAQHALGDESAPTDLGLALDERIKHLLIDEFQDTSVAQYELLRRLTADWTAGDGRTLFVVGDPMQSIYRFRKAEVGLFLRACRGRVGRLSVEHLLLRLNTRSTGELVGWFNDAFPTVLPTRADEAAGAVPYAEATPKHAAGPAHAVQVHPLLDAGIEQEAELVATLIAQERAADPTATLAVLVAGRKHLAGLVPRLHARGLGFRALDIEMLADRPVVQDLTALTRALVHPGDRTAWLAILRAPWCGLALADLLALVGDAPDATVAELLAARAADPVASGTALSADARQRLDRVAPLLLAALDRPRGTLAERITGLWHALGGPAATREARDIEDAHAFLALLTSVESAPEGFELGQLERRVAELKAPLDPQGDPGLQLMTIHKSKGLEFDVVIVPGLGRRLAGDHKQLMQWIERPRAEEREDVLFGPVRGAEDDEDPLYRFIAGLHRERADNERGRLFYVAATRARRRLHLVGSLTTKVDDAGACVLRDPPRDSLLATAWPALGGRFRAALETHTPSTEADAAPEPRKTDLTRLTADWTPPPAPAAVPVAAFEPSAERDPGPVFDWAGETARHVGTVVHRLLMHIAEQGVERFEGAAARKRLEPATATLLAGLGVPSGEFEAARERVRLAIERTLADPKGRWILGAHPDSHSEYALSGVTDLGMVHARIDRCFAAEGVRWIVDFKASSIEGGGTDAFLDEQVERYRPQLAGYAALLGAIDGPPVRCALYFPLLARWREIG